MTLTDPTPRTTPLAQDGAAARPHEGLTYEVRTFGCQMNVHDSERISGLLESTGYAPVAEDAQADLVVFNTCAVRENADNRLYGNLGNLRAVKDAHPGMQIAVGGCLAQKDRDTVIEKAPWVDAVFGTHNISALPALLDRARVEDEAQVEIVEALEVFPSVLPAKRESAYAGWAGRPDATDAPLRLALDMPTGLAPVGGLPKDLDVAAAAKEERVRRHVQEIVDKASSAVSRAEGIREFRILDRDFSMEEGHMTPSLKMKRAVIMQDFAAEIADIYGEAPAQG